MTREKRRHCAALFLGMNRPMRKVDGVYFDGKCLLKTMQNKTTAENARMTRVHITETEKPRMRDEVWIEGKSYFSAPFFTRMTLDAIQPTNRFQESFSRTARQGLTKSERIAKMLRILNKTCHICQSRTRPELIAARLLLRSNYHAPDH